MNFKVGDRVTVVFSSRALKQTYRVKGTLVDINEQEEFGYKVIFDEPFMNFSYVFSKKEELELDEVNHGQN